MGTTGIWLGLKQRSLTRASISLVFYLLLLPASLYLICRNQPVQVTIVLVITYCAIAFLMRGALTRVVKDGEGLQSRLRPRESM